MTTPGSLIQSSVAFWTLMAEAQIVMMLRVMGMTGILPADAAENNRMMAEKGPAFAKAMAAGAAAAMRGHSPDKVAMATIRPLRRKTKANVKRLSVAAVSGKGR